MSNLFSDFQVRKATLAALGGDITKDYRSVYDIDLAILEATKQSGALQPVVVETLPETGEKGKLYFVPNDDPKSQDNYKEYVWVNNAWECVGNAAVDLTGYAKISDVDSSLGNYYTKSEINNKDFISSTGIKEIKCLTEDEYDELTEKDSKVGYVIGSQYKYKLRRLRASDIVRDKEFKFILAAKNGSFIINTSTFTTETTTVEDGQIVLASIDDYAFKTSLSYYSADWITIKTVNSDKYLHWGNYFEATELSNSPAEWKPSSMIDEADPSTGISDYIRFYGFYFGRDITYYIGENCTKKGYSGLATDVYPKPTEVVPYLIEEKPGFKMYDTPKEVDLTGYAKISDVNSSIATEDTSIRNYVEGKINTVNNDIIEDENIVAEAIYTIKNQLDSSLAEKADITTVDASLALKADKSDTLPLISAGNFTGYPAGVQATLNKSGLSINSAGEVYASNLTYDQLKTATGTRYWIGDQALRNYVTGYIAEQDFANTEEVDASLNTKADWQIVDASLGLKADKITVDASLAEKADKTYVDSSLALYTKKTEIANFAKVSTLTQAEYEALEVKDPQTIYIISDAE